jgi:putative membrane protein
MYIVKYLKEYLDNTTNSPIMTAADADRPLSARLIHFLRRLEMRRSPLAAALVILAATLAAAVPGSSAVAHDAPLNDATIVAIFDAANTADIETGGVAEKRGSTKEVRDFGAMLARDHKMVRQQGRDLAAKLGVTPTPPKDDRGAKDHAAAMARLRSLEGAEFDRVFLRHEVDFHRAVIDAINGTLLPAIQNEELKALVEKVAPAFHAHMVMAQEMEKKIAGGTGGDQTSSR